MKFTASPAFARTLIAGYIGGSILSDGVADVAERDHWGWLWVVAGTIAVLLLVHHLRAQALRGLHRPDARWSRTDTANFVILVLLVALIVVNTLADATIRPAEQASAYTLAAVYTALLTDFMLQRRHTIQASTRSTTPSPAVAPPPS